MSSSMSLWYITSDKYIEFEQVPFHHPRFIMFSLKTTAVLKGVMQSVGGTSYTDLSRDEVLTYHTNTA